MKDHYTLLHNFLEKHFPAQLPKLEAIKDNDVEVIMMYNMYKKSAKNALKERETINEVKEMTFGAYLDDLDNRFVDLMKAAKGLNAEGSQEIAMRATINQNFTLFRNYISALKKEYSNELNKELTFSINEAKATCCHRCGRVHVKGSGCKRPYLKGKDSCAINEIETLKEFYNK